MEKYDKILRNMTELIEKSLFGSKDLKNEIKYSLKFELKNLINKLNLVTREEFEVQKKIIEKLQNELIKYKSKKKNKNSNKRFTKARKS